MSQPVPISRDSSPVRSQASILLIVLSFSGLVLLTFTFTLPIASAKDSSSPIEKVVQDDLPSFSTQRDWEKGSGGGSGFFGKSAGFWYVETKDNFAYWEFENHLVGSYTPMFFIPGKKRWAFDANPMPTGVALYTVQEQRNGTWKDVESFSVDQSNLASEKSSWWQKIRHKEGISLNGKIRVRVGLSEEGGLIVADSFKLKWRSPLLVDDIDPIPTEEDKSDLGQIKQEGNNHANTLSAFYKDLYNTYKRMSDDGASDCDDTKKTQTEKAWRTTTRRIPSEGSDISYHFPLGECTSWVQFRILNTRHIKYRDIKYIDNPSDPPFDNGYLYEKTKYDPNRIPWGDAGKWDTKATISGITVFDGDQQRLPQQYDVAQWEPVGSSIGHVGFVELVEDNGNTIWISDMNGRDSQLCYLRVRKVSRMDKKWPDHFISFNGVK